MAKCVYLFNKAHFYCLSNKHPNHENVTLIDGSKKAVAKLGFLKTEIPKQCNESGKGCPFYKK